MEPSFKFKYQDAGTHPISGQKLYSGTMIVETPDGQTSTYRAGQHTSQEKLKNDFSRMMSSVRSSFSGEPTTVKQNYGTQTTKITPSEDVFLATVAGENLSAPDTYELQSANQDGTITRQTASQQGIRQSAPFVTYAANINDPNYDATLDAIVDPNTGLPMYSTPYGTNSYEQVNSVLDQLGLFNNKQRS
tara:strand:+ start:761 stop:1330 length:570 start_codon:yes stop_codon:yes gene_type:complete